MKLTIIGGGPGYTAAFAAAKPELKSPSSNAPTSAERACTRLHPDEDAAFVGGRAGHGCPAQGVRHCRGLRRHTGHVRHRRPQAQGDGNPANRARKDRRPAEGPCRSRRC